MVTFDGPARQPWSTAQDRWAAGKAVRQLVPRSSTGRWTPTADRPDPIELLEQQAASRVADLVPIRYGRMVRTPFTFFRGAALPMASDLATMPRLPLDVQLCGDAHLSNFGGFASPDRSLVFDLNDFDETAVGPFDWDLKRLVASFEVAGRQLGLTEPQRRRIVAASARTYRTDMRRFAEMSNLEVWYLRATFDQIIPWVGDEASRRTMERVRKRTAKARSKDRLKAAAKLTHVVDGHPEFRSDPPLLVPIEEVFAEGDSTALDASIHGAIRSYRSSLPPDRRRLLESYRYLRIARKVVGVGSVGTRAWVVLFEGRDGNDPLMLQMKEAQESVLERFLGPSPFPNHGQRVVEGQRLLQSGSDVLLGYQRVHGPDGVDRDYYVRQLWDWKLSADIDSADEHLLELYAELCGWTLARAHARSGDRIAIAAYLGKGTVFDDAMVEFAHAYADQNERDHAALVAAIDTGRVTARTGI